jgi:hypothetical protein
MMMEAVSISETTVNFCQTKCRNIPEDSHLHCLSTSLNITLSILRFEDLTANMLIVPFSVVKSCGLVVVTEVSEERIAPVYPEYGDTSHDEPQTSCGVATKRSFWITQLVTESCKGAPTRAILIAQHRVYAVIIDGVGAVLKVNAMIEETLSEFEIFCANILASVFIVPSSVNIVQYLFSCGSVMVGT